MRFERFVGTAATLTSLSSTNILPKTVLKTGLTPSASGSAYLEIANHPTLEFEHLSSQPPSLKLSCTVHGPRPLQRSAPFSPQLLISTRVKFASFSSHYRRGYIPDASERDLSAHLETALRGVLIGERWPKSGIDVVVTILEGEENHPTDQLMRNYDRHTKEWGLMSILSGCITVASAALTDAGIDCVDMVTGGVAAIQIRPGYDPQIILDPSPSDNTEIIAACVIGYLQSRDELTELWTKGSLTVPNDKATNFPDFDSLVDHAVEAAMAARLVLIEAIREATEAKIQASQIQSSKQVSTA